MYEVIVVNDASTDDTSQVLYELSKQYENLWEVKIGHDADRHLPGKKYALNIGLKHATHDLIVMTDADCAPSSEHWLAQMVQPLHEGKKIVAGVGKYKEVPGFLNAFIRWETMHSFLQYSTYALAGKPYMAVGRNMACTRQVLDRAQRSEAWSKLPSGDDDLLMAAVANEDNTALVTAPEAVTVSPAKTDLGAYIRQKQRHLSTGKYYKPVIKALLGVYALSHMLVWILFISLLFTEHYQLAAIVMLCRCAVYYLVWYAAAGKMQERRLARWFLLCDIGWMLYNFVLSPYIILKNKKQWK